MNDVLFPLWEGTETPDQNVSFAVRSFLCCSGAIKKLPSPPLDMVLWGSKEKGCDGDVMKTPA